MAMIGDHWIGSKEFEYPQPFFSSLIFIDKYSSRYSIVDNVDKYVTII